MEIPTTLIKSLSPAMGPNNPVRKSWEHKYKKDLYSVYWNTSHRTQEYNGAIFKTRLLVTVFCSVLIFLLAHITGRKGTEGLIVPLVSIATLGVTGLLSYLSWKRERVLAEKWDAAIKDLEQLGTLYINFIKLLDLTEQDLELMSVEELSVFCNSRLLEQRTQIMALEELDTAADVTVIKSRKSKFHLFYTLAQALGVKLKPRDWYHAEVLIHTTQPGQ